MSEHKAGQVDFDELAIVIDPDSADVVTVCQDPPHLRERLLEAHPGKVIVAGDMARLFYVALAGRDFFEDSPEDSDLDRALDARVKLLRPSVLDPTPHGALIFETIKRTRGQVRPFLGTYPLDHKGGLMYLGDFEIEVSKVEVA